MNSYQNQDIDQLEKYKEIIELGKSMWLNEVAQSHSEKWTTYEYKGLQAHIWFDDKTRQTVIEFNQGKRALNGGSNSSDFKAFYPIHWHDYFLFDNIQGWHQEDHMSMDGLGCDATPIFTEPERFIARIIDTVRRPCM